MREPAIPANEKMRMQSLYSYSILDTVPEKEFDDITRIASEICSTPISLISLIDSSRQWFKSNYGLKEAEADRKTSFCGHAINEPDKILLVKDSRHDERFADNPNVTGDPFVVFYAGVPLVNSEGYALGTICIIDHKPRSLNNAQLQALKSLSNYVVELFEFKKNNALLVEKRKMLEQKLYVMQQIGKVAMVGGWELDMQSKELNWTSVTKEIHEVPPDFMPDLDAAIRFYKEGINRDTISLLVKEAIEKNKSFDCELKLITAKGNEKWIRVKGEAEVKNGKCIKIFGILQDIHYDKLKDIQIAQSEEIFRQVFNNAFTGMALVNMDGKAIKVNKSLCNMLGYTEAEMLLMSIKDHTHAADLNDTLSTLKEFKEGKRQQHQFEKRFIHKTGRVVYAIISISVAKDSLGAPFQIVQVTDVTAHKLAEQMIREEKKLLRTLIDNLPINIFIKDLQSRKILINKNEKEYMKINDEKDILGKNDYELYPEKSAALSVEEDQYVFKTGKAIISRETINYCVDGSQNWFLTSKIPLKNESNEVTGLLGISYNINERKKTERKLKDLSDFTAEQNMRLLNFAHIASHNLRSHAGNFSMLLNMIENETDEVYKKEMFEMLKTASSNLTETVDNLNEIAAVTTDVNKETSRINLHKAVLHVQNNIRGMLIENDVQCINEIDNNLYIQAVPAYLDSILLNFFTNSIKYRSPHKKAFIKLTAKKMDECVVLSIEDNGLGINMKKYGEKLFGMYKTFHGNKDAKGIGLFITKNQVEAMRGKIEVESTPGEGTTFKIFFCDKEQK